MLENMLAHRATQIKIKKNNKIKRILNCVLPSVVPININHSPCWAETCRKVEYIYYVYCVVY